MITLQAIPDRKNTHCKFSPIEEIIITNYTLLITH